MINERFFDQNRPLMLCYSSRMIYLEQPENFKPRFEIVSCFIEVNGQILLLHRHEGKSQSARWGRPGGKREEGETLPAAMAREIQEETGLVVAIEKLTYVQKLFVRYASHDFIFHMFHLVLDTLPSIVICDHEHQAFTWVTPQEALGMDLIEDEDACIKMFYKL